MYVSMNLCSGIPCNKAVEFICRLLNFKFVFSSSRKQRAYGPWIDPTRVCNRIAAFTLQTETKQQAGNAQVHLTLLSETERQRDTVVKRDAAPTIWREAAVLHDLILGAPHPFFVKYFGWFQLEDDTALNLVLEYSRPLTSADLNLRQSLRVLREVLDGLTHMHKHGYVHCDVKVAVHLFWLLWRHK